MSLITDLVRYVTSTLTYVVYLVVQMIIDIATNFMYLQPSRNDVSCHVMRIIWKRKFFLIDVVSPSDFLAVHQKFTSPTYVLRHNVSLYCVTTTHAVFIEEPENIDVYSSKTNAFLYIAQLQHATKVICMPLDSLYRLTTEMQQLSDNVCYMANTGRCGSTLLGQALGRVPGTMLLAEPDVLTNIGHLKRDRQLTTSQYEQLLVAIVKILCKPMPDVHRYCIKTRSCASQHISTLPKYFPIMKFVFGYRNSLKTVSSFLGLMISETVQSMALYLINSDQCSDMIPFFRRRMHFYFCYILEREPVQFRRETMNAVEMFTYAWCMCINLVKEFISQGHIILPVLYEDMLKDKRKTLTQVFRHLDIDEKHVDEALNAFEEDAQKGSVLEQANIADKSRRTVSPRDLQRANVIMARFGLPNLGEPFVFHV